MRRRAGSLLLEVILGLAIILLVVLVAAGLFPTSYQASLQAARMSRALALCREVLETQKHARSAGTIGNQTVHYPMDVQGQPILMEFFYRVDDVTQPTLYPKIWKATVQWHQAGKVKELFLVGASDSP